MRKCFDTLWAQEAVNDLYELRVKNEELLLVHKANECASIAVKTPTGMSERADISNTIMHGTVWAGISCTATMDKLGKLVYKKPHIAYKYRDKVVVPLLRW